MDSSMFLFVALSLCAAFVTAFPAPVSKEDISASIAQERSESTTSYSTGDDTVEYDDSDSSEPEKAVQNPNDSEITKASDAENDIQIKYDTKSSADKWNVQDQFQIASSSQTDKSENVNEETVVVRSDQSGQQYELGAPEYIPDLPVFDRTLLFRIKQQKLAALQSSRS